ncbi:ATP-binding protein [Streptomyces sp. NPDC051561]|uniref:ATP-binding protein n=1 Tax=Streptomyces sp. NPDC051561 TaxID=3365658 RepID=UPI0037AF1883
MSMRAVGWARTFPMSGGVREGRRWTREHLAQLPWYENDPDTVDAIILSVSELLTNAHLHARSDAQLALTWDSRCVHASVHDDAEDGRRPVRRSSSLGETSGRGIAIVDALADSWEAHDQQHGKAITACFVPAAPEKQAASASQP